jgi:hypothetical protein
MKCSGNLVKNGFNVPGWKFITNTWNTARHAVAEFILEDLLQS